MEDSAIREGFADLKDGSVYGNICEASVCRAKADWLVGMNATRAYTTKYFKKLAVGRVQTPKDCLCHFPRGLPHIVR